MPDKTKLDAYIKTEKARNKQDRMKRRIDYNFGEGFPKVNAEILSAMLDVFQDNPAFISAFDPERSAIIFTAPANITALQNPAPYHPPPADLPVAFLQPG